jgi:hypothetical protein
MVSFVIVALGIHQGGETVVSARGKARRASQKRCFALLPAINSFLFSDL